MDNMSSTRQKLIQLLQENDTKYISGQYLSDKLNISRTAIWKHMNELKKDGYVIEGKANRGYRIISYPNKVSENTVRWNLQTEWLGKHVVHYESVPSTQPVAHKLAQNGASHGTVVIANEQTEARGRMDRPWYANTDKGMWLSIVIRPTIPPYIAPQLTLLTATVLAEVLADEVGVQAQIKWPNDLLINGKKVAGILTEMQAEQDQIQYVIIGIGLNVNQTREDFVDEVAHRATSLFVETNKEWDLVPLIQRILETFEAKYTEYIADGFHQVKKTWEDYGFKLHETIEIKTGKERWKGVFLGVAEDGALLAKRICDQVVKKVYSAEIAWFD